MACIENIPPKNADSEMEEGEIIDEIDDLSDISSEEEFLLRQRLQVLENYNHVLERKKAKHSSIGSGKQKDFFQDLSEISGSDLEDSFHVAPKIGHKKPRHLKLHHKQRKRKDAPHDLGRHKDVKKKNHRKKRLQLKVISASSEESEDEYRNKRRRLADAVNVNRSKLADAVIVDKDSKNDKSSLQARLQKMLSKDLDFTKLVQDKHTETSLDSSKENVCDIPAKDVSTINDVKENISCDEVLEMSKKTYDLIDLCTDDDVMIISDKKEEDKSEDTVDASLKHEEKEMKETERDSDEDLELLRQHALKTKASKPKSEPIVPIEPEKPILSEDEDSDTAELRLICLKSALLKKAIEMKQKQKLKKRLSQSSNLQDDYLLNNQDEIMKHESENNTDIESVDMEIGSEGEEKVKDELKSSSIEHNEKSKINYINASKDDEVDEDEDLLRARLLTSLTKNLPKLVDPTVIKSIENAVDNVKPIEDTAKTKTNVPEEKRIIINVGGSDSEGEHEATKNLTKMHMKLSEQKVDMLDFQQKLDMFLKSTRMQVENQKLPDVVQNPATPKTPQKFVAKAVNHLPKSEQIEYKNLVKRMAELEKIKQARQSSMNLVKQLEKDTLKPRNITFDTTKMIAIKKIDEQIALSRKKIAEESSKILKLKEEATKLSQKYKIVATELKNITTAITFNKKEQRTAQIRLSKIRVQHQRLLNSSTSKHSIATGMLSTNRSINKSGILQKENNPTQEESKNRQIFKSIKVSVTNDVNVEPPKSPKVQIRVDGNTNKKSVKFLSAANERISDIGDDKKAVDMAELIEEGKGNSEDANSRERRNKEVDDYESPLQALANATCEDPNAILCPFEVGGNCKDADCKYFHPKTLQQ